MALVRAANLLIIWDCGGLIERLVPAGRHGLDHPGGGRTLIQQGEPRPAVWGPERYGHPLL